MQINYLCISFYFLVDIFTRLFDDFISIKFLIAVFLPTSSFIAPYPSIILAKICQPPRLFHPPLLFETREYTNSVNLAQRWSLRTMRPKYYGTTLATIEQLIFCSELICRMFEMSVMSYHHITRSKIKSWHSKIKDWHQLL